MMNENLKIVLPEEIDGLRKTDKNVYVFNAKSIRKLLQSFVPNVDKLPARYVPQGKEVEVLEDARKNGLSVLLSGPTGVGKTLLVTDYAAVNKMPLLILTANEDLTDGKIRGTSDIMMIPAIADNGKMYDLKIKTFAPSPLTLAAMADEPVVLFVDELHKVRSGVSSLFHSITNERMVYALDLTGENYKLHPETLVVAAVNPTYGEGGIERIDPALRQRFSTIALDMPTGNKLIEIIKANIKPEEYKKIKPQIIEGLVRIHQDIVAALDGGGSSSSNFTGIDARLNDPATINAITEAPSPRVIVRTLKQIISGLQAKVAIEANIVNTIITDFNEARKALMTIISDNIPNL